MMYIIQWPNSSGEKIMEKERASDKAKGKMLAASEPTHQMISLPWVKLSGASYCKHRKIQISYQDPAGQQD